MLSLLTDVQKHIRYSESHALHVNLALHHFDQLEDHLAIHLQAFARCASVDYAEIVHLRPTRLEVSSFFHVLLRLPHVLFFLLELV